MRKAICAVIAGFIILSGYVLAEDFSADIIQKGSEGSLQGKIYFAGQKSRIEATQAITIVRVDKNVMWILMPEQTMYMEQSLTLQALSANAAEKVPGEIERTSIGKEMIDGKSAEKYKVTYMMQGKKSAMYQWYIPDFSMPIKMASEDGSWITEYKNIKVGPQDNSLFEVPSGWKKFSHDIQELSDLGKNFGAGMDSQE